MKLLRSCLSFREIPIVFLWLFLITYINFQYGTTDYGDQFRRKLSLKRQEIRERNKFSRDEIRWSKGSKGPKIHNNDRDEGYADKIEIIDADSGKLVFEDQQQELLETNQQPPMRKKVIYHALHKTGSEITRQSIRIFCRQQGLNCLTYGFCDSHQGKPWLKCAKSLATLLRGRERNVDYGSMTPYRLENGCCPKLKYLQQQQQELDILIEHFPLNAQSAPAYLRSHFADFSDLFRFTIMRHPVQQFVSYHDMLMNTQNYHGFPPQPNRNLSTVVQLFTRKPTHQFTTGERVLYDLLTNSQSKELGLTLDEDRQAKSFEEVMSYVNGLDFVGIFGQLEETWRQVANKLNWPVQVFDFRSLQLWPKRLHDVPPDLYEQIVKIQNYDTRLYSLARKRFEADVSAANKPSDEEDD